MRRIIVSSGALAAVRSSRAFHSCVHDVAVSTKSTAAILCCARHSHSAVLVSIGACREFSCTGQHCIGRLSGRTQPRLFAGVAMLGCSYITLTAGYTKYKYRYRQRVKCQYMLHQALYWSYLRPRAHTLVLLEAWHVSGTYLDVSIGHGWPYYGPGWWPHLPSLAKQAQPESGSILDGYNP